HIVEITRGAAAGGDDRRLFERKALEHAAFQCPEGRLAVTLKVFGDWHACFIDNHFVEVDKHPLGFECELAAPGCFATSHEADKENGLDIIHLDRLFYNSGYLMCRNRAANCNAI